MSGRMFNSRDLTNRQFGIRTTRRGWIPLTLTPLLGFLPFRMLQADEPAVPALPKAVQASLLATGLELTEVIWSVSIRQALAGTEGRAASHAPAEDPPSLTVSENIVLLQDVSGIRALDLRTGRPAWPIGDADSGDLLHPFPGRSLEAQGDREPVPGGVIAGQFWIGTLDQQLIALDLKSEGRLAWRLRVDELLGDIRAIGRIVCTPLVDGQQIFVAVRNDRSQSHSLICCSSTGHIIWRTKPGLVSPSARIRPLDRLALSPEDPDDLVWSMAGERLICINRETGAEHWSQAIPASQLAVFSPEESLRSRNSLLVHQGEIFLLSGGALFTFQRSTGKLLRSDQSLSPKWHLLGLHAGMLVVSGRGVSGIDAATGTVRWELGGETPELQSAGEGLLVNGHVLWPSRSELWQIDIARGTILQRIPLQAMISAHAGSVILHQDILLMTTKERCMAFRACFR